MSKGQDKQTGLSERLACERARLYEEHGLQADPEHYRIPEQAPFTRADRDRVTVLFGGLTVRQERLIEAGMRNLGYRVARLHVPTKEDFQTGRAYGSPGMCSPAYFVTGALVNHLRAIQREKGLSNEDMVRDYVLCTAGSCGPCRYGMYEDEYRLVLRNAGYEGFRIITFQQQGGLTTDQDAGMVFDMYFLVTLLGAMLVGDALNALAERIRPYETVPGQTDEVFERVVNHMARAFETRTFDGRRYGPLAKALSTFVPDADADQIKTALDQLGSRYYLDALRECATMIDTGIEVDHTRLRPKCKIVGEFWAQMTEGDGNFRMFSYLESHGAQVMGEPLLNWLLYLLDNARCLTHMQKQALASGPLFRLRDTLLKRLGAARFGLFEKLLRREYRRIRNALGGLAPEPPDTEALRCLAEPYYDPRITGGEGYLEIGKAIYYSQQHLAHLILGLKPFGCMPSTQSDGAMAAAAAHRPDMLYLAVETSGEGDINAYSRVQMALSDAKNRCADEFNRCLEQTNRSLAEIRAWVANHPELRRPLLDIPRREGVAGHAANFVLYVADLMDADPDAGPAR